jgi:Ca-activated chloride channel family protein
MSSNIADNHYVRLGVSKNAPLDEIKVAYHVLARRLHPDVNQDPGAHTLFLRVKESYEVLSNARKRSAYDERLGHIDTSPGVNLNLVYSREAVTKTESPQLFYGLLEIDPGEKPKISTRPPLNLTILIDTSTSMSGERMARVKSTAQELLKQLREEDVLSIVAFNDKARVVLPAQRGLNLSRVLAQISLLQPSGGTEMYQGLKVGLMEAQRNAGSSSRNHLFLITDGHTYGDENACVQLAEEAKMYGIPISGLGIGTEWNDALIDRITGLTGGSSVYVEHSRDIRKFMEQKFASLSNLYAENVRLSFIDNPHVEIQYAFRTQPEPSSLETRAPIKLGHIHFGSPLSVVFEFLVRKVDNPVGSSFTLLDGVLNLDIPSRTIPTSRMLMRMERPVSNDGAHQSSPDKIVKAMSKLTLYRMQEQARKDVAAGDVKKATQRMQHLATHLLAKGKNDLAKTVIKEAKRLEDGKPSSEEATKQIKYGTRALLLPPGMEL